ncbi:MAG: sulfite exporter TauE/SafE family protein [Bdellovibrionales bacterium]|nr:sulfite exporter TauE/SafE family protein [Bdellovibrionales bacterium]
MAICLVMGALHALEPGHGKSAFVAHLLTEKKNYFRPLALALTTAVTHAASILLISLLVHGLLHTAFSIETVSVFRWMNLLSGLMLVGLGTYIFYGLRKPMSDAMGKFTAVPMTANNHGRSCSCPAHRHQPRSEKVERTWKTLAIGFAVGLIPCPSALAALSTALASHDLSATLLIISMFSLGIFLSLTFVGAFIAKYSTKFLSLSVTQSRPHLASHIQIFVFIATGFWHISMFQS